MIRECPLIIVLGLSPTGLYAVRELGRAGFPVLGVTDIPACATGSRFLSHPERFWQIPDEGGLLTQLVELGQEAERPPILLPTSDRFIEFVANHYSALCDFFVLQDSYSPDYVFNILEKGLFYKLCAEHGLPTPGIWYPETKTELLELATSIPFPCILKPKLIHLAVKYLKGKKVLLAKDRDEYLRIVNEIPEGLGGWIIQEVIPGPESNIMLLAGYFDRNSDPVETFTARKLRQYPPGFGSASLVESETHQEVYELSVRFLKGVGYRGICGTEFKLDPRDGQLKVIEINPRPTLWFHLSHASGKRVVEMACRDLAGLPVKSTPPQKDGVVWKYSLKDLYSKTYYSLKGKEFIFPAPEIPPRIGMNGRTWAVYDPDDKAPAWAEPVQFVRKFLKRW